MDISQMERENIESMNIGDIPDREVKEKVTIILKEMWDRVAER